MNLNYSGNQQQYGGHNQFSHQGNFSGQGHQFNVNLNGPQGQYGMNQPNNFDSGSLPTTPEGIRQHITKRPYTQTFDFQDITYSLFPKKMKTMCLTHERFLLLKGIEILGYARELSSNQKLPFHSLSEIPAPKTVVPLSGIAKVDVQGEKLIVLHADQQKTVWEFHCPTKGCALEWQKKIIEALDLFRQFQNSGFQSTAEFYRFKKGGNRFHSPPPMIEPPKVVPHVEPTPPPQNNFNYRVHHDDQISRSIFDNSGPKANPSQFPQIKSNINNKDYYSVIRNPEEHNVHDDGHKCSHCGSTLGGSSQRSFTINSLDSTGRYPKGVSMGGQRSQLQRQYDQGHFFNKMGNIGLGDLNNLPNNNNQFHYNRNY